MAIVTISRLAGSAGDDIAAKVAESLSYDIVDTGLIVRVAERAGVSVEKVRGFDEKSQSRAAELLKSFISPRMSKILAGDVEQIDTKTFAEYATTIIRGLAEEDNMVIVGRASQFILKDNECAFHVRIIADDEFRVARMVETEEMSEADARDFLKKSDSLRKHYVERHYGGHWDNPYAYHLTIDAGRIGVEDTVDVIVAAVKAFSLSHDYVPGVRDRRKTARRSCDDRRQIDRRMSGDAFLQKEVQRAFATGRQIRNKADSDRRHSERRSGDDRRMS